MSAEATYPLPAFHYSVTIGDAEGGFSEVSGLSIEHQIIEYRDGRSQQYGAMKMPGIPKVGEVTLTKGIMKGDNKFYAWLAETKMNVPNRKDVVISILDEEHKPTMSYKLGKVWPTKVEGADLKGDSNEVALEKLTLAFETLTIENG